MSDAPPPSSTFEELRRVGIKYAQDASRTVWSDYNVHDPGVTFLEQTCFALSQISYQSALPIRDLLTTPNGDFLFRQIGFADPSDVLRTGPVTHEDLERCLSGCAHVDGVSLRPKGEDHPGVFDLIIYADDTAGAALEAEVRSAFDRVRPLGSALGDVAVAQRLDVILQGRIEIAATVRADAMGAEIYHAVRAILRGQPVCTDAADDPNSGATRASAFETPEGLFQSPSRASVPKLRADNPNRKFRKSEPITDISLASHLGLIRTLPGVREIENLSLRLRFPKSPPPSGALYLHVVLPDAPEQNDDDFILTVEGNAMRLDSARLREDFIRIKAERRAHSHHHISAPDWDVLKPGRRRKFDLNHVDCLLPIAYRVAGYRPEGEPKSPMAKYRGVIDSVLHDMSAALGALPDTFKSDAEIDPSDPVLYRARRTLLDYFLSLQWFEMPVTTHTGLHYYRGAIARHRFELDWRLRALNALPELSASRAAALGDHGRGGFLGTLALLCDLDLAKEPAEPSALAAFGIALVAGAPLSQQGERDTVIAHEPVNILDLLAIEDPDAQPFEPAEFAQFSAFIANGKLCPQRFHRLAQLDAIRVLPAGDDAWQVVIDFGDRTPLWRVAEPGPRRATYLCAARLRATWRALHRRCETVRLLEADPVRSGRVAKFNAFVVLPGWTARCALPNFRQYVEGQVARLAPAHLYISVLWEKYDTPAADKLTEPAPNPQPAQSAP